MTGPRALVRVRKSNCDYGMLAATRDISSPENAEKRGNATCATFLVAGFFRIVNIRFTIRDSHSKDRSPWRYQTVARQRQPERRFLPAVEVRHAEKLYERFMSAIIRSRVTQYRLIIEDEVHQAGRQALTARQPGWLSPRHSPFIIFPLSLSLSLMRVSLVQLVARTLILASR